MSTERSNKANQASNSNHSARVESTSRALSPIMADPMRAFSLSALQSPTKADNQNQISLPFLFWVFREWWRVCIPAGLVLAALTGAVAIMLHVPQYEAKALLMIENNSPYIAFSNSGRERPEGYIKTQQEIIRSAVVLERVLSRPEIAAIPELVNSADRVETLRENLWVKPLGGSELYNICYTTAEPRDAAAVVNAVSDQYMEYHAGDDSARTQRVIDLLEEERRRRAIEVERLRRRVVALTEEATGKDPFTGSLSDAKQAVNPIGSIVQSLTDIDLEREMLKAQREFLVQSQKEMDDPLSTSGLLKLDIDNHAETTKRQQIITQLMNQMEDLKNEAVRHQKNPDWTSSTAFVALDRELKQREQDLVNFKEKLRAMILIQRKEERAANLEQEIGTIDQQLALLETRNEVLTKRFDEQLSKIQVGEGMGVEVEFARAELLREEKVFEMIASRKLALQTEMRAPARVTMQRKADIPAIPLEPLPVKVLVLTCSMAMCVPFGLALLKEVMVRRVSDIDQLAEVSRVRVMGEIAELPVRHVAISPRKMAGRLQRDAHTFAESINSLRTNLMMAQDLREKHVLAVMSAVSGESKTSVATSLSMSIANATGRPTLIIDGDMRSPDVAAMLKTKSSPGLFEVLSGKCRIEDAIQHVADSQLYVLPAGRPTRGTYHVVAIKELTELLDRLRPKFVSIVIDTPPILGASEAIVLAKSADAVLMCSLSGVSRVKQLQMAIDRLDHAGVSLAGAVLSGSSVKRYAYRYGYYPVEGITDN
jgi:polysaccharide biosynthesis transport protein